MDTTQKSTSNPLVAVGIGCFVLLVLVGAGISFALKFFAKKAGTSMLQNVIQNKTGVKTNLQDLEKGKMEFTDTKTGQKVSVGSQELPANFPKDFPVYTDAKVAGSVTGSGAEEANGMFVTFTTTDQLDTVVAFYKNELQAKGWTTTSSINTNGMQTWAVEKDTTQGSVTISFADGTTTILVTLGTKE
jgi:hypothetical protein